MPLTLRLAGGVRTGAGAVKRGGEVGNGRVRVCQLGVGMNVYYWRTWYKAVCGGKGGSEGHVLRDTTSRGLRGRV